MKKMLQVVGLISLLLSLVACSLVPQSGSEGSSPLGGSSKATYNYGEALQKAIMFYEFQMSGKLPTTKRNNWRGDSGLGDLVQGGWYDAGDHVKFNLPMAYSATMLGWAVYEYKSAFQNSGQLSYIQDQIKWVADYLVGCKNAGWVYQVGDGSKDHAWWGPAEVMQMERPAFKGNKCSAVWGESAAALAVASIVLGNSSYLTAAKEYYAKAETEASDADYTAASGYYNSWSGFRDELAWAGAWLYLAGAGNTYLQKAEQYAASQVNATNKWALCWDDKGVGAMLLLAKITGKPEYKAYIERHLDFWTVGYGGSKITYTPKGLAWLDQWGSLRYATTTAFVAFVYSDWSGADPSKATTYRNFAVSQVNYALGSAGRSFVVGFGTNPPKRPHHRTAHSSWADSQSVPPYHRHTLYGALVGGPGRDDSYTDDIANYVNNEVACDYNAGFVGALAKMYLLYGGTPIANFRADETPSNLEFFVQTSVNASGYNFLEVKALLHNLSGWPARVSTNLSFRYFIDISELVAKGYNANNITISMNYNQDRAFTASLKQWSGNIYYIELKYNGKIYPGGQSAYKKEVQFRFAYPNGVTNDNSNDFSYQYINNTVSNGLTPCTNNPNVPVYENGVKLYGNVPGGSSSSSSTSSSSSSSSTSSRSSSSSVSSSSSSRNSSSSSVSSSSSSSSSTGQYVEKTAPFSFDGAGTYYWKMANIPNYINSWNLDSLVINGVELKNVYKHSYELPPKQNGYYYITYKGSYPWSHFEAK